MSRSLSLVFLLFSFASTVDADEPMPSLSSEQLPDLPEPVSNNAVAMAEVNGSSRLYSFLGMGSGKSWRDVWDVAFEYDPEAQRWQQLPSVPGPPRLAASAVGLGSTAYIFGGYTVAADGKEKSRAEVYAFRARERRYVRRADMPVPVDDSVALP